MRTLQAELRVSGRVARQRLRGRILAGLIPGALRLEAVAPVGGPVFILAADGPSATLLLPRDRRVLRDAPPEEILHALVGARLGPDDLRAVLAGCVSASGEPISARSHGTDWVTVDLSMDTRLFLRREAGNWRVVAGRRSGLDVEYLTFAAEHPREIHIRNPDLSLTIDVSQLEVNAELSRDLLTAVKIPAGVSPISLDELRASGPLGE